MGQTKAAWDKTCQVVYESLEVYLQWSSSVLCLHKEGLSFDVCFRKCRGLVVVLVVVELPWKTLQPGLPERRFVPAGSKNSLFIKGLTLHILLSALCTDAFLLVGSCGRTGSPSIPLHQRAALHTSLQQLFFLFQHEALLGASLCQCWELTH